MTCRSSIFASLLALSLLFPACRKKEPPPDPPERSAETNDESRGASTAGSETAGEGLEEASGEIAEDGLGPGTEAQQQLLVKAKSAFLNEQWDAAEREFETLTQTGPLSGPQVTAYIALGQIYNESDRSEEAQELYEELLERAPDVAEVHFVMARTLAEQGDTTKAMREFEKTIKLQSDYVQAMVELAGLYAKSGRKEEAEQLFYKYEKKIYSLASRLESEETPWEEKLRVLEIFSFVDDDRANQAIAKTVLDPHPAVRERAIWLAVDLDLGAIKPNLRVLATNDTNRRVRLAAKEALRSLEDAPETGAKPTFVRDPEK